MLQNLDLQAITNLLLIIFLAVFLVKVSKVFDKLVKQSREERETVSEHVEIARPEQALGTLLKDNPVTNSNDDNKKILLEIELPDLPERITLSIDKLPELLKLLKENNEESKPQYQSIENPEPYREEAPGIKGGIQEGGEASNTGGGVDTYSFMEHPSNPWIDIVSKVSGLEFSGDGKRGLLPQAWLGKLHSYLGRTHTMWLRLPYIV